jgi:hypothetical protein
MANPQEFDVFLSYRVASDQDVAEMLFDTLETRHGLKVFWDKKCLKLGQRWEEGFVTGLHNSLCVVAVVSPAALKDWELLVEGSKCDNVLLEHTLALQLHNQGQVSNGSGFGRENFIWNTTPSFLLTLTLQTLPAQIKHISMKPKSNIVSLNRVDCKFEVFEQKFEKLFANIVHCRVNWGCSHSVIRYRAELGMPLLFRLKWFYFYIYLTLTLARGSSVDAELWIGQIESSFQSNLFQPTISSFVDGKPRHLVSSCTPFLLGTKNELVVAIWNESHVSSCATTVAGDEDTPAIVMACPRGSMGEL